MIGRVLVTVAVETGDDVLQQLDEPLWLLLFQFHHIEEREQRRALMRRLERVDAGMMTALAFNQPAKLDDELRSVHEAIAAFERGPIDRAADLRALRARGQALIEKLDGGRVLSPDALVS